MLIYKQKPYRAYSPVSRAWKLVSELLTYFNFHQKLRKKKLFSIHQEVVRTFLRVKLFENADDFTWMTSGFNKMKHSLHFKPNLVVLSSIGHRSLTI